VTNADVRQTTIPDGSWREVALSDDEYALIVELLGRTPTPVELGMFGAMWSEHCGYKHTRPLLKQLPTTAPWVIYGPGENAGVVDIGDGLAAVFKVESHNHPSAVEPYEGAATGVGGIVRDIFTMGARPIALLDGLRFGPLSESRNQYLFDNVVGGIGGYGNCLGIPTVGGDLFFDRSYNGNPLVNAMCVGIVRHDQLVTARASGVGNLIMLIGADTGRDGLHGATFASVDDPEASHRGVVQVGNPFLEKLLLEACLELLQGSDVVAMQDLGAAGLTSSTVECASRGDVGAEIDVSLVPRREQGMTAYEVMLSESQERMLLVVPPDAEQRVREVIEKWLLHAAVIGRITDDGMVRVRDGSEVVAEVSAHLFTDACPTYVREAEESPAIRLARSENLSPVPDISENELVPTLVELLRSPNIGSRKPVFERYDHTILTNTVVGPGEAGAAILRLKGTDRAIAVSLDCNSRYCYLTPRLGAQLAVAEATRNVSCVGGRPIGLTNCLNFGNPERPHGSYQLQQAVKGLAEACEGLGIPVVSGNVSLYNETAGSAVFPTPMVGVVGVLANVERHATARWREGDVILLLGSEKAGLGGSEYLSFIHERVAGHPPTIDLELERRVQVCVRTAIEDGLIRTAHDLGDGGMAVALAEMAVLSGVGATLEDAQPTAAQRVDSYWFGEGPSRVVIAIEETSVDLLVDRSRRQGVSAQRLGRVGGESLVFPDGSAQLQELADAFESALTTRHNTAPSEAPM
jgi:phosphoribosylformylglycinamidine synthase subunit PurL